MTETVGGFESGSRVRILVDVLVGLGVVGVFWTPSILTQQNRALSVFGALLAVAVVSAVALRWRWPVASAVTLAGLTVLGTALGLSEDPMLLAAWALYAAAVTRVHLARLPVLVLVCIVAVLASLTGFPASGPTAVVGQRLVVSAAVMSGAWLLGTAVGRQILSAREAERARATERLTRVQLGVARDVHDVVGHTLGVIGAEAGVTRNLPDATEDEIRASLGEIEQQARAALEEVQDLVRSLRNHEAAHGDDPVMPAPGIANLGELVERARAAGVAVEDEILLTHPVEEVTGVVVYRIAQEALSNVARHAPGARCSVSVGTEENSVRIQVRDKGPGISPGRADGFGLRGIRERARLAGGEATTRNVPDGGFEVAAILPRKDGK